MHFNIVNWVWICWSGQDSNSGCHVLHVVGPIFIIREQLPSSGGHPLQQCLRADADILQPVSVIQVVTPQTIPQLWPPDSLNYRRELILQVMVSNFGQHSFAAAPSCTRYSLLSSFGCGAPPEPSDVRLSSPTYDIFIVGRGGTERKELQRQGCFICTFCIV